MNFIFRKKNSIIHFSKAIIGKFSPQPVSNDRLSLPSIFFNTNRNVKKTFSRILINYVYGKLIVKTISGKTAKRTKIETPIDPRHSKANIYSFPGHNLGLC